MAHSGFGGSVNALGQEPPTRRLKKPMQAKYSRLFAILLATPGLIASGHHALAEGPSFDCARAASPVEKAICADPALAALDVKVATAFQYAMDRFGGADRDTLLVTQREWVKRNATVCSNRNQGIKSCLTFYYQDRLGELNWFVDGKARGQIFTAYDGQRLLVDEPIHDMNYPALIADLDERLTRSGIGGHVISCGEFMEVGWGKAREENGSGGDCVMADRAGVPKHVLICRGNYNQFKVQPIEGNGVSAQTKAQFATDYCPGGN